MPFANVELRTGLCQRAGSKGAVVERRMTQDSTGPKSSASVIRIVEVGPRDGLQNESDVVPTAVKVSFVDALSKSGVAEIEAGSFVSPRAIPQLATAMPQVS